MMDYSKMKWRCDKDINKDVRQVYPDLALIFKEHIKKIESLNISVNIFIRYVVLTYHQYSPYIEIDDIAARKRKVLSFLEQDTQDNILLKPFTADIAYAVLQFLKFEHSSKYKKKVFYEELLAKNQAELMENQLKKTDLDSIEKLEQMISKLSGETNAGDEELNDFAESFDVIQKRKIFPEEQ